MKFGDSNVFILRVLAIFIGLLFAGFAVVFFGSAWQRLKTHPLHALFSAVIGLVVFAAGLVCTFLLFE